MATVTYKSQPAIEATKGNVPLSGTAHIYTVGKVLWPEEIETFLRTLFVGRTLHVCCGKSRLGDVRLDADPQNEPDIICDAADMRAHVADGEFETVLCDPPYNGKMQWNHDLLKELIRVASKRVIFQHWFLPARKDGGYKKAYETWKLSECHLWQPRTYFGRVQVVSVFDNANKAVYATLAQAIHAKNAVARHRGDRWRKQLRIYRTAQGWCLTKSSKSNFEYKSTKP